MKRYCIQQSSLHFLLVAFFVSSGQSFQIIPKPYNARQGLVFRQNDRPQLRYFTAQIATTTTTTRTSLAATDNDSTTTTTAKTNKKKSTSQGVYSRPSAAIERGSGFFVPGLEGPKVRVVFGITLLVLTVVNHILFTKNVASNTAVAGNTFSEGLAVVYSFLVLLQGAIEYFKESRGLEITNSLVDNADVTIETAAAITTLQQTWHAPIDDLDFRERVEWAASSFLSLTPATDVLLVGPGNQIFSLRSKRNNNCDDDDTDMDAITKGCNAALETLSSSSSGRVSLPLDHPAAQAFFKKTKGDDDKKGIRCVILQSVGNVQETQLGWLVASDQLLASFTKRDLQWLGQLARYINPV